jgi:hypothetical protein
MNYVDYDSLCFKIILDKIWEFEKNISDTNNKIIIVCSIDCGKNIQNQI